MYFDGARESCVPPQSLHTGRQACQKQWRILLPVHQARCSIGSPQGSRSSLAGNPYQIDTRNFLQMPLVISRFAVLVAVIGRLYDFQRASAGTERGR
jgi:hypothetical protein